jgi:hypothetical protein
LEISTVRKGKRGGREEGREGERRGGGEGGRERGRRREGESPEKFSFIIIILSILLHRN